MFDKEFENSYILNTRIAKGKAIIEKWHPTSAHKFYKILDSYHLAVLGSIADDVINKCGMDTPAQVVEIINKYSTKKIEFKKSNKALKTKAITLLKKWNPDNYDDISNALTDDELILLANVDSNIISAYGLNTIMDVKLCIKMNESSKSGIGNVVEFYNGNYNEFLYNTFISHRKIISNTIDSDITIESFDYEFFGKLMNNMVDVYMAYHKKN